MNRGTWGNIPKDRLSVGHTGFGGGKARQIEGHLDKQTDEITDIMTQGQTDRQTDRQTRKQTINIMY